MKITPVATFAAVAAALVWAAKGTVIGLAGGLGKSPLESPLFALGLLAFMTAVVSLVWNSLAGRHTALRIGACVGAVVLGAAFAAVTTPLFESLIDSWVGAELNLWILALALLAVVTAGSRRSEAA